MSWRARLSTNMQELRFIMCTTSPNSGGVRSFLDSNYAELKKLNPRLPILMRTGEQAPPKVYARYDWGEERGFDLHNATEKEVEDRVRELTLMGEKMEKSFESIPKDRDLIDESDVRKFDTY
ncbi:mitochondrial ribosomal protein l51 / s25 / cib8 domain containing protein [Acanthamoeba castellanii str. Neff]|uniref:Mitochondrial ribosomal protein l51 / s25 / cib8 domain containing protein n=1 Tax=Acanthamoeba castellanii (strain ATCC 30010 / Neff) TaxID=1257118 RepID=L8GN37_ACACF|nr:mitochondrial ribosomal protein l51 / s25 / cib8 domain containing protein [Acanthamoeba castellanii str. Neff]ELR14480.1 mitochondrial ribosomal protein l51 / s25 / cib8 domain containing protein [Acanthamoeba castellanii str. Neff]